MRNSYGRRAVSRGESNSNKQMIWIIAGIIAAIFIFIKIFSGSHSGIASTSTDFMEISPSDTKSIVYITPKGASRKQISETDKLYAADTNAYIESGSATGTLHSSTFDFDEKTEISYTITQDAATAGNIDNIRIVSGRTWVNSYSNNLLISLDNLSAKIPSGNIAMLEQANVITSVVYAIRGDIEIITDVGQYTLKAGEKIILSPSDIKNAQTKLADKVGPIDASLVNNKVFIRNNGEEILKQSIAESTTTENTEETTTEETQSGATSTGITTSQKFITFTQPIDGATLKTNTTTIIGTLLSTEVTRVTLNDVDAVVSPVNENFTMENFKLNTGVNNIVYKAYNNANVELERGVLVVYGPNSASTATTIIPENFPNLKDFVITSPASNPYVTTESYIKVQGTIPKNTVKYITVNNFRLTKFVANSTSWYYHANASIGTIKEWTNLYHIKFFDNNDKLIHTQVFTIIKDVKTTDTSTTTSNEDSLFPN